MQDQRIRLRNPVLAAILAFLLPGLGHAYQRRFFKACIYAVCILGTFLAGMAMGEWQPVYYRWDSEHSKILSYCTQAMVGLPAMPALVQSERYKHDCATANPGVLDGDALEAEFTGMMLDPSGNSRQVSGRISLRQLDSGVEGELAYIEAGGQNSTVRLGSPIQLKQKVYPSPRRGLSCALVSQDGREVGSLVGAIPRSFLDYCEVPLGAPGRPEPLAEVHGRLGKRFDLAAIFTWIAGLLNVLAIWDAFEGPAYGYGDESPEPEGDADGTGEDPGDKPLEDTAEKKNA